MNRKKTLLTEQDQWDSTVDYYNYLNRAHKSRQLVNNHTNSVCIFHGTHRMVCDEDALILTFRNGMVQRFGMTGVSSKGARLNDFHLPLRIGFGDFQLPDDFIGMQWNDPVVGRFVADLRASFRSRVSANSPAPWHCPTLAGVDTNELTCFGLYKSGRMRESTRNRDPRHYLRFYPDGSAAREYGANHYSGFRISSLPRALGPKSNAERGTVSRLGDSVVVELFDAKNALDSRYEGSFENGRLWLSCQSRYPGQCHARSPYRFHPFSPDP